MIPGKDAFYLDDVMCLTKKAHYSNFTKRVRKQTNDDCQNQENHVISQKNASAA